MHLPLNTTRQSPGVYSYTCSVDLLPSNNAVRVQRLKGGLERETGSGKLEAGSWEREAGSGKMGAGSWKREAGNGKLGAGRWEREAGSGKLGAGSWERETGNGKRGNGKLQLETGRGEKTAAGDGERGENWKREKCTTGPP